MVALRICLIILFFVVLIQKPVYQGFRCKETDWEWTLTRLPLWKAIIGYCGQDETIEIEWAKVVEK